MARPATAVVLLLAAVLPGCTGPSPPVGVESAAAAAGRKPVHPAHGAPSRPAPSPAPAASPPAEDRRITFAAEDQEIWRVVARIAELAEADVTCDPEHVRGRVTVNFVDVPWRKALESLAHQGGCVVAEGPGGVVQVLSLERSYGVEEPVRRR